MSVVWGGSLSALFLGGAAAAGAAAGSTGSRVVVEPEILRLFNDLGYPWLVGRTYDEILMDRELCAAAAGEVPWGLYITGELLRTAPSPGAAVELAGGLLGLGLSVGEAATIATAVATAHDMVFLVNERARAMAREFGLTPASPLQVIVDAFRKELITPEEFVRLASELLRWEKD